MLKMQKDVGIVYIIILCNHFAYLIILISGTACTVMLPFRLTVYIHNKIITTSANFNLRKAVLDSLYIVSIY